MVKVLCFRETNPQPLLARERVSKAYSAVRALVAVELGPVGGERQDGMGRHKEE